MTEKNDRGGITRFGAYLAFIAAAAGNVLLPYLFGPTGAALPAVLYYLLLVAVPCVLLRRRKGAAEQLRLGAPRVGRVILIVAAAFIGVLFTSYLTALWTGVLGLFGYTPRDPAYSVPETPGQLITMLVFAAVLPGVCEEFLFRGVILGGLETRTSARNSILICAVLFACLHASAEGLLTEIVIGMVLGALAVSEDSLYAAMIYHTMHNAFVVILSYLTRAEETAETVRILPADIAVTALYALVFGFLIRALIRGVKWNSTENKRMTAAETAACAASFLIGATFLVSGFLG